MHPYVGHVVFKVIFLNRPMFGGCSRNIFTLMTIGAEGEILKIMHIFGALAFYLEMLF